MEDLPNHGFRYRAPQSTDYWQQDFINETEISTSITSALLKLSDDEGWTAASYERWSHVLERTNPLSSFLLKKIAAYRRRFQ